MTPHLYFILGCIAAFVTILIVALVVMVIVLWTHVRAHHENLQALQMQVDALGPELSRAMTDGDVRTMSDAKSYIDSRVDKASHPKA